MWLESLINQMFNALVLKSFPAISMRSPFENINVMSDLLANKVREMHERLLSLEQDDLVQSDDEIKRPRIEMEDEN
jgi:hypothetical protein